MFWTSALRVVPVVAVIRADTASTLSVFAHAASAPSIAAVSNNAVRTRSTEFSR